MEINLTGTGVALVTPFTNDDKLDFQSLQKLLDHVIDGGVDYLVVCGTTGEAAALRKEEKAELLQFIVENRSADLPIIYGIGGNNTRGVLHEIDDTD